MKDWHKVAMPTAILILAGLGGLGLIATAPKVQSVVPEKIYPPVRVMEVSASDIPMWVRSQGTVVPRTESDLVPEVSGPVVWISPALVSGGFFNAGDVLFRIDARDYEASVARARAEVARAEGEDEHARAELRRQQGLAKSKATSPSHLSNARRASRVTGAALDSARIALAQAQRDLDRTSISAPFQGRVREEHIDMGQFVGRGAPVAKLYATDFAEIRLPIADRQLAFLDLPNFRSGAQLDKGPTVILRASFAGREHQWVGSIVRTEGEIDARSRMVHVVARVEDPYGAKAALEAPDGGETDTRPPLAVGLFVRAEIAGRPAHDAIALPRSAIRNNQQVLVVDQDNRLFQREVEIIRIDQEKVLVRIALAEGERICTSPLQIVVEGMHVQPVLDGMGRRS
ncbi:MAG: efflux RND transporter periplasmic adaptor subunit [Myxococcota bacterium]|nr:efflux RND transporter periplasmic adaptor subunit [Myxococcota bacterium]